MIQTIFQGFHTPYAAWVPQPVSIGDLGNYREIAGDMEDTISGDPKELLLKGMEELGLGNDPSTLTVTFTLGGTTQWLKTYGEYFQQVFHDKLGVNVVVDQNEWGTFQSKTNSGDYQMAYMVWTIDYNDPYSMLEVMKSTAGSVPTFWTNEEYDELLNQASVEMDDQKRAELMKEAEHLMLSEAPICPVINEATVRYSYSYLKNLSNSPFDTMGAQRVYISGK